MDLDRKTLLSYINEFEPENTKRNIYGYVGEKDRKGRVTPIWNPFKHRIITETHFRFPPGVHFYYFGENPIPFHTLYLYGTTMIDSTYKVEQIAKTLIHLNPDIHYEYFLSLMYEVIHPSYPYTDHRRVRYRKDWFEKVMEKIFKEREEPNPYRYKMFFFNPNVYWDENERIGIVAQVFRAKFWDQEQEFMDAIEEIYDSRGRVTIALLAEYFSCAISTVVRFLQTVPEARARLEELRAEYKKRKKRERKYTVDHSPIAKKIVNSYWKKQRKVISVSELRKQLGAVKARIPLKELPKLWKKYTDELVASEKYITYMANVKEDPKYIKKFKELNKN